jgi:hypothetical protein
MVKRDIICSSLSFLWLCGFPNEFNKYIRAYVLLKYTASLEEEQSRPRDTHTHIYIYYSRLQVYTTSLIHTCMNERTEPNRPMTHMLTKLDRGRENAGRSELLDLVQSLYPPGGGGFWFWTMSRAGSGLPVPDPPQLRHGILPDPAQVRQPVSSPSDQRLHRHLTRPEPPHVAQRGRASHLDAAGSPSPPRDRFAMATPATMPSPADAITAGATISFSCLLVRTDCSRRRDQEHCWIARKRSRSL